MFFAFWLWSMWDLSPQPGNERHTSGKRIGKSPSIGRPSVNHWTSREVPERSLKQLFWKSCKSWIILVIDLPPHLHPSSTATPSVDYIRKHAMGGWKDYHQKVRTCWNKKPRQLQEFISEVYVNILSKGWVELKVPAARLVGECIDSCVLECGWAW